MFALQFIPHSFFNKISKFIFLVDCLSNSLFPAWMRLIPQVDSVIQKILSYLRVAFCCCRKQVVIPQGEVQNPVIAVKRGSSIIRRASINLLKGVSIGTLDDGGITTNNNNNNVIGDDVSITFDF